MEEYESLLYNCCCTREDEKKLEWKFCTESEENITSPLHLAIYTQSIDCLQECLRDPNTDVNIRNRFKETPLLAALRIDNRKVRLQCVKALINAQADVNMGDFNDATPLHQATRDFDEESKPEAKEIFDLILSQPNCNVNVRNIWKETPLHVVYCQEAIESLTALGAPLNQLDFMGNNALILCVGYYDLVAYLIKKGENVNQVNKSGFTALHQAILTEREDVAWLLLNSGADPNFLNILQVTPLEYCHNGPLSDQLYQALWDRTRPAYLLTLTRCDRSIIHELVEKWDQCATTPQEATFLIAELFNIFDESMMEDWQTFGRTISYILIKKFHLLNPDKVDYFISNLVETLRIPLLSFILFTYDYNREHCPEEVEALCCKVLTLIPTVNRADVDWVYKKFGNCELLDQMLKLRMTDDVDLSVGTTMFTKIFCNVGLNARDFFSDPWIDSLSKIQRILDIQNLCRYFTPTKNLLKELEVNDKTIWVYSRRVDLSSLDGVVNQVKKRGGVPSLMELSRDASRLMLAKESGARYPRDLRLILDKLEIPKPITRIITMEVPLYRDIPKPDYYPIYPDQNTPFVIRDVYRRPLRF